jgi:hypothetical protein
MSMWSLVIEACGGGGHTNGTSKIIVKAKLA